MGRTSSGRASGSRRTSGDDFDPYRKWLGISSKKRPPSHYELLGIGLDEEDGEVIDSAAERRIGFVRGQLGKGHDEAVHTLIYQLQEAQLTLKDPQQRREYDRRRKLWGKRKRRRQVDPNAHIRGVTPGEGLPPRVGGSSSRSVGEGSDFLRTYAGIVAILAIAFGGMLAWSLWQPWERAFGTDEAGGPNALFDALEDSAAAASDESVGVAAVDVVRPPQVASAGPAVATPAKPGLIDRFDPLPSSTGFVAFSPSGDRLAMAAATTVRVVEAATHQTLWDAKIGGKPILAVRFSDDGRDLFVASETQLRTLSPDDGLASRETTFEAPVTFAAFSSDGSRLATTTRTGTQEPVNVYHAATGSRQFTTKSGSVSPVAVFTNDGDTLLHGWARLHKLDLRTRSTTEAFIRQDAVSRAKNRFSYVGGIATSRDGQYLATGSSKTWNSREGTQLGDRAVRLWRLSDGNLVRQFDGHEGFINAVAFTPDGRLLISAGGSTPDDWHGRKPSADRAIRVWRVDDGQLVHTFTGHEAAVTALDVSPDGTQLLSIDTRGHARRWRLPRGDNSAAANPATRVSSVGAPPLARTSEDPPLLHRLLGTEWENQLGFRFGFYDDDVFLHWRGKNAPRNAITYEVTGSDTIAIDWNNGFNTHATFDFENWRFEQFDEDSSPTGVSSAGGPKFAYRVKPNDDAWGFVHLDDCSARVPPKREGRFGDPALLWSEQDGLIIGSGGAAAASAACGHVRPTTIARFTSNGDRSRAGRSPGTGAG